VIKGTDNACDEKLQTKEITRLNGIYKRILAGAGVTFIEGAGRVIDPHTVEVQYPDGQAKRFTTRHILIATGGRAVLLDIPGKVSFHCFYIHG
jgi:glutathione reductase (NADPH)